MSFSCVSLKEKHESDFYKIINLSLQNEKKIKDSIYLFEPLSKKEFNKKKKEKKIHNILKSIGSLDTSSLSNISNFLKKEANIDFKNETPYFKKQIKQYKTLDTSKITLKEIRYFPRPKNLRDTIKYMSGKYDKYFFGVSNPVFVKNGKYALVNSYRHGGVYVVIFKKENNIWREHAKYLYLRT